MRTILIPLLLCFSLSAISQDMSSVTLRDEFRNITGFGKRQSGFEGIQTHSNQPVTGTQFFTDDWSKGSVTSIINKTIGQNFVFLYDKVRQELFFKPSDTNMVLLADKDQIKSFTINSDRPHNFFPGTNYDPSLRGDFIEQLVDGKYQLLKLTSTSYEKANANDMLKIKQGDFSDSFVDHLSYYIYYNKELRKIPSLNESRVRKVLKEESKKVDAFFKANQNSEFNEQMLMNLVSSLNS